MSTKEAYKQKIEAELELVQAKLAEFKAQAKISTADARIRHAKQLKDIEQKVGATKAKLKELGAARRMLGSNSRTVWRVHGVH